MKDSAKIAQSIVGTSPGRPKHDFYPTPTHCTEDLLRVEDFGGIIWEPACGDGAISKVLVEKGLQVVSTDLIDRGYGEGGVDFLESTMEVDSIITNPPYSLAQKFVEHALFCTNHKVAMLLKLAFLEGQKRQAMFMSSPLARVWVYSKRVTQYRGGIKAKYSGMIAFAWFVWEHGYEGEPVIRWL